MKKTLWKNNIIFVKGVVMMCVNLIILGIEVVGKRSGGITFVPPLVPS
jgi:hypothetical protein